MSGINNVNLWGYKAEGESGWDQPKVVDQFDQQEVLALDFEHLTQEQMEEYDDELEFMNQYPTIKALNISGTEIDADQLEHIAAIHPELVVLSLSSMPENVDEMVKKVTQLFPNLEYLDVSRNDLTDDAFEGIENLAKLTYLNIGDSSVTSATAEKIANMKNLRILDIHATDIDDEGVEALLASRGAGTQHLNVLDTSLMEKISSEVREKTNGVFVKD